MIIIETTSRSNLFSWIAYGLFGVMGLIFSPISFTLILLNDLANAIKLLPVLIVHTIIGVLCLRMILWFIKGKESISIDNNKLFVKKSGTFWIKKQKIFDLNDVKNLSLNESFYEKNSPSRFVQEFSRQSYIFRIQNTGRIRLLYNEHKSFKFLDNIDHAKAHEIIKEIKNVGNIS